MKAHSYTFSALTVPSKLSVAPLTHSSALPDTSPRFYALSLAQDDEEPDLPLIRAAGNKWAQKAEYLVLTNFGKISIHRLKVDVALYTTL